MSNGGAQFGEALSDELLERIVRAIPEMGAQGLPTTVQDIVRHALENYMDIVEVMIEDARARGPREPLLPEPHSSDS